MIVAILLWATEKFANPYNQPGKLLGYAFNSWVRVFPKAQGEEMAPYRYGPKGEYNAFGKGVDPRSSWATDPVTKLRNGLQERGM